MAVTMLSEWFPEELRAVGGAVDPNASGPAAAARDRARTRCLVEAAARPPGEARAIAAAVRSVPAEVGINWLAVARAWRAHADLASPVLPAVLEALGPRPRGPGSQVRRRLAAAFAAALVARERAIEGPEGRADLRDLEEALWRCAPEAFAEALAEAAEGPADTGARLARIFAEVPPGVPVPWPAVAEAWLKHATPASPAIGALLAALPRDRPPAAAEVRLEATHRAGLHAARGQSAEQEWRGLLAALVATPPQDTATLGRLWMERNALVTRCPERRHAADVLLASRSLRRAVEVWRQGLASRRGPSAVAHDWETFLDALAAETARARGLRCLDLLCLEAPRALWRPVLEQLDLLESLPVDADELRLCVRQALAASLPAAGLGDPSAPVSVLVSALDRATGVCEDHLSGLGETDADGQPEGRDLTVSSWAGLLHAMVDSVESAPDPAQAARHLAEALCQAAGRLHRALPLPDWMRLVHWVAGADPAGLPPPGVPTWAHLAWLRQGLRARDLGCPHQPFASRAEAEACAAVGRSLDLARAVDQLPPSIVDGLRRRLEHDLSQIEDRRRQEARSHIALSLGSWGPWCDIGRGAAVTLAPIVGGRPEQERWRFVTAQGAPASCERFHSTLEAPDPREQVDIARRYGAMPVCLPARRMLVDARGADARGGLLPAPLDQIATHMDQPATRQVGHNAPEAWGLQHWYRVVSSLLDDPSPSRPVAALALDVLQQGSGNRNVSLVFAEEVVEAGAPDPRGAAPEEPDGSAVLGARALQWLLALSVPTGATEGRDWLHRERALWLFLSDWASLQRYHSGRAEGGNETRQVGHSLSEAADRRLLATMPAALYEHLFARPLRKQRVPAIKRLFLAVARSTDDLEAHVLFRRVFVAGWTPAERAAQERIPETLKSLLEKAREELVAGAAWLEVLGGGPPARPGSGPQTEGQAWQTLQRLHPMGSVLRAQAWSWAEAATRAPLADRKRPGRRAAMERLIDAGMLWRADCHRRDLRVLFALAAARLDLGLEPGATATAPPAGPAVAPAELGPRLAPALHRLHEMGVLRHPIDALTDALTTGGTPVPTEALLGLVRAQDLGDEDLATLSRWRRLARDWARDEGGPVPTGTGWLAWSTAGPAPEPSLDTPLARAARTVSETLRELSPESDPAPRGATPSGARTRPRKGLSADQVVRMLLRADELGAAASLVRAAAIHAGARLTDLARTRVAELADLQERVAHTVHRVALTMYPDHHHLQRLALARLRPSVSPSDGSLGHPSPGSLGGPLSAPPTPADPMRCVYLALRDGLPPAAALAGDAPVPRALAVALSAHTPVFFEVDAAVHRADKALPALTPGGTRLGERLWLREDVAGGRWLLTDRAGAPWGAWRDGERVRWSEAPGGLRALRLSPGRWRLSLPGAGAPVEVRLTLSLLPTGGPAPAPRGGPTTPG